VTPGDVWVEAQRARRSRMRKWIALRRRLMWARLYLRGLARVRASGQSSVETYCAMVEVQALHRKVPTRTHKPASFGASALEGASVEPYTES